MFPVGLGDACDDVVGGAISRVFEMPLSAFGGVVVYFVGEIWRSERDFDFEDLSFRATLRLAVEDVSFFSNRSYSSIDATQLLELFSGHADVSGFDDPFGAQVSCVGWAKGPELCLQGHGQDAGATLPYRRRCRGSGR